MSDHSEAFVAFDTSKLRNAVAIADGGRGAEPRFLGEIDNTPAATAKLVRKLTGKYERVTFCYEAGPTGYGLYRQIKSLGQDCIVAAPSLIPKKAGDRVKTNRRDAISLAKLLRWLVSSSVSSGQSPRRSARLRLRPTSRPRLWPANQDKTRNGSMLIGNALTRGPCIGARSGEIKSRATAGAEPRQGNSRHQLEADRKIDARFSDRESPRRTYGHARSEERR